MNTPGTANEASAGVRATGVAVGEISSTVERMQRAVNERIRWTSRFLSSRLPQAAPIGRATEGVVDIVELGQSVNHRIVRATTGLASTAAAAGLKAAAPQTSLPDGPKGAATVAGLSAAFGDHLDSGDETLPLTTPMGLRLAGRTVGCTAAELREAYPDPGSTIVVFVHGLAVTELNWSDAYAEAVRAEGGTPLHVRYNTGRSIATNGADLATLLADLHRLWPVPVRRLILVGHSMGGLVIRAACAAGEESGLSWIPSLTDVITLATPHKGSPVERLAHTALRAVAIDPVAAPLVDLGNRRSRGIKDLRFGAVSDADWAGAQPEEVHHDTTVSQPLPSATRHHAVVAALPKAPEAALADIVGDGLVLPDSAAFAPGGVPQVTMVRLSGTGHNAVLDNPEVEQIIHAVMQLAD